MGWQGDPFVESLADGARSLGIEVSEEQMRRFVCHRDLVLRWGEKMNLTTVKHPVEMAEKLFLDSMALFKHIGRGVSLCDAGSGAGFPGLVLLVMDPSLRLTMIEARRKKSSFLENALRELGLAAQVRWERLGWSEREPERFDEAVSRAAFPPKEWLRLGASLVKPGGRLWLMLGPGEEEEATCGLLPPEGFSPAVRFDYILPRTGSRRRLLGFSRDSI